MGNNIRKMRKSLGLSQSEFALKTNVHQTAVSQWETGRTNPDMSQAIQIAEIFGVSTDYILGRAEDTVTTSKTEPNDEDIRFALFGEVGDISDAAYEEIKRMAPVILEMERKKREQK
ncbi:MAG: helix-turn-helix domain-containing protein [Oscillospiraceae bacterium]|jgi:transcriptional regulator with XRE-family HTH domain|nr:helix-turn-helix domain-containing protein [Oscillospiraceae bacterium]